MKCIKCGHQMEAAKNLAMTADVRDEEVLIHVDALQCNHCHRIVLDRKARRAYERAAADAYRQRHELLTTADFARMARNLGMGWKQFAKHVPVGIATLKRWLGGEVQSQSMDFLVRLRADPEFAQKSANDLFVRVASATIKHGVAARKTAATFVDWPAAAADTQLADAA